MAEYRQLRFAAPPGATDILLVRHGESEALVDGRPFPLLDGQGDPALAPEGRDHARLVGQRLAAEDIDQIYVTSLRRTAQTATPLAAVLGIEPVIEPDLREVYLGEWEGGLLRKKLVENGPLAQRVMAEQRWEIVPGAESAAAFSDRVRQAVQRIAVAHVDQRVVVFTHGGVIADILAQATGAQAFAFGGADNGSISQIVVAPGRWIVRRFNDIAHLEGGLTSEREAAPVT
jgi:probable phosphoglycerate mutase